MVRIFVPLVFNSTRAHDVIHSGFPELPSMSRLNLISYKDNMSSFLGMAPTYSYDIFLKCIDIRTVEKIWFRWAWPHCLSCLSKSFRDNFCIYVCQLTLRIQEYHGSTATHHRVHKWTLYLPCNNENVISAVSEMTGNQNSMYMYIPGTKNPPIRLLQPYTTRVFIFVWSYFFTNKILAQQILTESVL